MKPEKEQLRKQAKEKRISIEEQEKWRRELRIQQFLFDWEQFQKSTVIKTYVSTPQEVDTKSIIEYCWRNGKTVLVPKINWKPRGLTWHEITSWKDLTLSKFDVPEPIASIKPSTPNADLNLVPGLLYTKEGYRLGYGGGFYDIEINTHPEEHHLGLCFEEFVVKKIPVESNDQRVSYILTEENLFKI